MASILLEKIPATITGIFAPCSLGLRPFTKDEIHNRNICSKGEVSSSSQIETKRVAQWHQFYETSALSLEFTIIISSVRKHIAMYVYSFLC